MFPREMPCKRKNDQDFSPVKHRCSSDLNVSMHSQDSNDNSLHEPYSREVEALIIHNVETPYQYNHSEPWQPKDDDPGMKQLEEESFLACENNNVGKMTENFEMFSQSYQNLKDSDMHKDKNIMSWQHEINKSNSNQEEGKGPYHKRLFKESRFLLARSPNGCGEDDTISTELSENMQYFNYNQEIKYEKNNNCSLSFQPLSKFSIKNSYNNKNKLNISKNEFKDKEEVNEEKHRIENNLLDYVLPYPTNSTVDVLLNPTTSAVDTNSRTEVKFSNLNPNPKTFQSSSNYFINDSHINENKPKISKNEFINKEKDSENKQQIENNSFDYALPYPTNSTVDMSLNQSTSVLVTNSSTAVKFSDLNPKSKSFYPDNQEREEVLVNKFPPSFNVKDQRFSKTSMNSMAQTLKILNKSLSKGKQDSFSDYNLSKSRTLENSEKNVNIDTSKGLIKSQEIFENEPFNKYSNNNSRQMIRSNTYIAQRDLSTNTSVSTSDSKNWRQMDNINPYSESQSWKSSNSFGWRQADGLSSSAVTGPVTRPFIGPVMGPATGPATGPAYSSDNRSSISMPSADSQNWRADCLNTSSDNNNWRQVDPVIKQTVRRIIGKRDSSCGKEYLVRWIGTRIDTWEKDDTLKMLHMTALQIYLDKEKQIIAETVSLINTQFDPGFVDTHCHLDFIYSKLKTQESGKNYRNVCEKEYTFPVSYEGCIACFCDPLTFREIHWYAEFLENDEVYAAFGCHPHHSNNFGDMEEKYLKIALQNQKTVALGEIGLDYSGRNDHSKELQREVFKRQLTIAKDFKKPLVIHCRDAHDDCIQILKETVPKDMKIHRHCFTESWDKAVEWMSHFKNCYIGITNLISQQSKRGYIVKRVAAEMPLERLLLETDAPYFHPYCLSEDPSGQTRYVSNPGMALYVASEIAKVRGCHVQEVLWHARKNTRKMYGI